MRSTYELQTLLSGPVMSVHTPFLASGEIDFTSLRGLIERGIAAGSTTMLLTYGDSLFSLLTDDEVDEVTRVVTEQTAGRAAVVAADRIWWTGKTIAFARYAREVGADLLMVLPPDWARSCTVDTFVDHYAAVAAEIPVMVVTNVFSRSTALGLEVLRRLRDEVPGIIAIKDDLVGGFARKMALLLHGHWAIISGGQKKTPRLAALRLRRLSVDIPYILSPSHPSLLAGESDRGLDDSRSHHTRLRHSLLRFYPRHGRRLRRGAARDV